MDSAVVSTPAAPDPVALNPLVHDRPLTETLVDWLGSAEREAARLEAPVKEAAARGTGLLDGPLGEELRAYFDRATRQVARYLEVPVSLFSLIEGGCQTILASTAPVAIPDELPADTSLCIHVRDSGRDLVIDDVTRSLFAGVADNAMNAGVGAYLGTPVYAPSGEPIGSLCAIDLKERTWGSGDLDLLRALAEGITDKIALLVRREEGARSSREAARAKARGESDARARDLFRAMVESIPHVVLVQDGEGHVLSASGQARPLFDLAPESLVGGGWRERLHPDDAGVPLPVPSEGDPSPRAYVRLRGDDGAYRRALLASRPFPQADVGPVHLLTATDVSDA